MVEIVYDFLKTVDNLNLEQVHMVCVSVFILWVSLSGKTCAKGAKACENKVG